MKHTRVYTGRLSSSSHEAHISTDEGKFIEIDKLVLKMLGEYDFANVKLIISIEVEELNYSLKGM
jgi:hypothetical protein